MSIWNKILKIVKEQKEPVQEKVIVPNVNQSDTLGISIQNSLADAEQEKSIHVNAPNEKDIAEAGEVEKKYSFQFTLTDEIMRKRIVDFISPITDQMDVLNLQYAYGVFEAENNIFLTRIKSSNAKDDNTGETYHTTHFVVLVEEDTFSVSYTSKDIHDKGELTYDIPDKYRNILVQAFDYWRDYGKHKEYEKELKAQDKEFSMLKLNADLRKPLFTMIPEPQPIVKQHFDVNNVEDAKTLFYLCNTDCYRMMKENYDEETIDAFNQYADSKQKKQWIVVNGKYFPANFGN